MRFSIKRKERTPLISLKVNKANIIVEQKEILTSQRVGLKVHFEFSKEWDELNKIVVC